MGERLARMYKQTQECGQYQSVSQNADGNGFTLSLPKSMTARAFEDSRVQAVMLQVPTKLLVVDPDRFEYRTITSRWLPVRGGAYLPVFLNEDETADVWIREEDDTVACTVFAHVLEHCLECAAKL